jgi:Flp pilus assembly protein TadD
MKLRFANSLAKSLAILAPLLLLAGCQTMGFEEFSQQRAPHDTKYYSSDEDVQEGARHFHAGNFGNAERHFRMAVERNPRDAAAWMGLAASYDRLRRFDLADQAYEQAGRLTGITVSHLNNRGYSYLLRGSLREAHAMFTQAAALDPGNPTVANNLELLNSSRTHVTRLSSAY